MRLSAIVLLGLLQTGCGGYLAVEGRSRDPVVYEPEAVREVSRGEAVEIAIEAARAHGLRRLSVREVERERSHWEVELRGRKSRGHTVEVEVKVDRWAPRVLALEVEKDDDDDDEDEDD